MIYSGRPRDLRRLPGKKFLREYLNAWIFQQQFLWMEEKVFDWIAEIDQDSTQPQQSASLLKIVQAFFQIKYKTAVCS